MSWLGLDIGGANIKVADGLGYARSYGFAMWKELARLAEQIRAAIMEAPRADKLAVTMTGELADCFATKAEGVRFILEAVGEAAGDRTTLVYLVDGRMVSPQVAGRAPLLAAASNWHVLARFAGRFAADGSALLIDVGSTTCDVIPLIGGMPAAIGMTDTQRLLHGELVYTGVERSPVCAVIGQAPYRGQPCPVVQELFATMRDAYLVLGKASEDPTDIQTADGKPATKYFARARLGRMIAADEEEFGERDAVAMAESAVNAQVSRLAAAIGEVMGRQPSPPQTIIVSGHGEFLASEALRFFPTECPVISLGEKLGGEASRCAPAHALAVIAREMVAK